jgi:hypothetical protein
MATTPAGQQPASFLAAALDEAEKTCARQRATAAECDALLAAALDACSSSSPQHLPSSSLARDLAASTKGLHGAVAKLAKAVDRAAEAGAGGAAAANGGVWRALPAGEGWRPPKAPLDAAVAAHLYREGRAELADAFCAEAGVEGHEAIRAPYAALHRVLQQVGVGRAMHFSERMALCGGRAPPRAAPALAPLTRPTSTPHQPQRQNQQTKQMRQGDLGAALEWARQNRRALLRAEGHSAASSGSADDANAANAASSSLPPSSLELWLHALGFVLALVGDQRQAAERQEAAARRRRERRERAMMTEENDENDDDDNTDDPEAAADARARQAAALAYARAHLSPFRGTHLRAIQRLMACLLWASRPARESPYPHLLAPVCWEACARELARRAASALGASAQPPLAVAVAAGGAALPHLIKLSAVLERQGQDGLRSCGQVLPVEIELGEEFAFCSVFACPVSREPSSAQNPPVLLPCGHVLCEQSVARIARSRSRAFKCPYCPMEARVDQVTPIVFP